MASPLSEIKIGSPLPQACDQIFNQIINGTIEILNDLNDLHLHSSVALRSGKELGLDVLNGSWNFTPTYMDKTSCPMSYSLGHTIPTEQGNFTDLLRSLAQKAEKEMFFNPLWRLRGFILNHDTVTGKTDLSMPKDWLINIDESMRLNDFMALVESYVNSDVRKQITAKVYELFTISPDVVARIACIDGEVVHLEREPKVKYGRAFAYNMTPIFKFLNHPCGHNLTQDKFTTYRKLVNL